jgi:hypothetical protein
LAYYVGQDENIVVKKTSLEEYCLGVLVQQYGSVFGVGAGVAAEVKTDVVTVGEAVADGLLEVASAVETAHLLGRIACEVGTVHVEP